MGLVLHRLSIFLLLVLFAGAIPMSMAADCNRTSLPAKQATRQKTQATKTSKAIIAHPVIRYLKASQKQQ